MLLDQIERQRVRHVLKQINRLAPKMRAMSDEELQKQTDLLRQQLATGKTVDQILPQAYATVREADYRILGMFPYDVQVMGAIVLNRGYIAEMKTGEGKTLTATMPLYLNALSGKGAMLVTPNGYLAERDEKQLAPVYNWLGLTASTAFRASDDIDSGNVSPAEKRAWYKADIVYTTASSLAFDYLFDNLAGTQDQKYLRPFNYVVIDEVDDVLLDQAQSPFVVSSEPEVQSNLYQLADDFVCALKPKVDYKLKRQDKAVWLTYQGVRKAESYFRITDLYAMQNRELYRHIALALRAHFYMKNGHDYLVRDGKVTLLDEADGRLKKGVKVSTGLHQAVEQKEHVKLTPNQKKAAAITFPSLFGLFNKVSGMSGTAKVNENEFINVYNMKVIPIPTNKPVIRQDLPQQVYLTTSDKLMAAIKETLTLHAVGRPVLLVAGSVENSEIISEILLNHGITHNVLNAFNAAREAEMVKMAGQKGAVTVATNMAGRGTDIKLGPGVKELGGLAVIGTEMLAERVRLQLAGRAGRQGDPGTSKFYISLEDSYIAKASTNRFKKYYRHLMAKRTAGKKIDRLKSPRLKLSLAMLKSRIADNEEQMRQQTNKYEIVMQMQRHSFYQMRNQLIARDKLEVVAGTWISEGIDALLAKQEKWDRQHLQELITEHFSYDLVDIPSHIINQPAKIKVFLEGLAQEILLKKFKVLVNHKQLNHFYHTALLSAMDSCWIDEVDYLTKLKVYLNSWSTSGRDSGYIYQVRAYHQYQKMIQQIRVQAIDKLLLSTITTNEKNELVVLFN